jgi:hypothetical protein
MENISTIINEFDNAYKDLWNERAPIVFFYYILRARDVGHRDACKLIRGLGGDSKEVTKE